jgi:mono/diheme cytochrome c family protein
VSRQAARRNHLGNCLFGGLQAAPALLAGTLGAALVASLGCSEAGPETAASGGADVARGEASGSAPTFYQDVAPLFSSKCVRCHQAGGIGPFPLNDYQAARARALQIADYTRDRVMPPFGIETGGSCGSFDENLALTQEQIDLIGDWARGEKAEGRPVEIPLPAIPELEGATDFELPEFTPVIQGGPLALFDEYRCFLLDPGLAADAYVTGYDVRPGNSKLVHHAIAFIVDPNTLVDGRTNAEIMQNLHDSDPNPEREGWSCFGAAGDAVKVESIPATWGPGEGVVNYPPGLGVPLRRDRKLVVQVHYNMAGAAPGQSDRTRLRLRLEPSVQRRAVFVLEDPLLGSLQDGSPVLLQPDQASVKYTWTRNARELGLPPGVPLELINLGPHMHGRGHKFTFEVDNGSGFECQGRVNAWDFNWQGVYTYTPPLSIDADTRIRVTCDYDTRGDTEAISPGWGTRNEMCLAGMMLALPPGLLL